jgi:hypothetical protein
MDNPNRRNPLNAATAGVPRHGALRWWRWHGNDSSDPSQAAPSSVPMQSRRNLRSISMQNFAWRQAGAPAAMTQLALRGPARRRTGGPPPT